MANIDVLRSENERLRILAEQDSLTGLLNRRTMEEKVKLALKDDFSGAFVMLDLDSFKFVNDEYGHLMGDRILQEIGRLISCCFFKKNICSRIGGDEFAVFMTGENEKQFIRERVEGLQNRAEQMGIELGLKKKIGLTAGVAFAQKGDSFDSLYERADCAMRIGKMAGKNKLRFYEPFMDEMIEKTDVSGRKTFCVSDMKYIIRELKEPKVPDGTYFQDYPSFLSIYRLFERLLKRHGLICHIVLITMMTSSGDYVNPEKLGIYMEQLQESIRVSLRVSDICTRYSNCQFLVMFPGAEKKDMDIITSRIEHTFLKRMSSRTDAVLSYGFYPLESSIPEL